MTEEHLAGELQEPAPNPRPGLVGTLEDTRIGCRNRALLTLGFAGAFRRSELVALDAASTSWIDDPIVLLQSFTACRSNHE